jgi:hypothetical protein
MDEKRRNLRAQEYLDRKEAFRRQQENKAVALFIIAVSLFLVILATNVH